MNIKKSLIPCEFSYELTSWVQNTDCCDWNGVRCDDNTNRVEEINIISGDISGQIPSSVGNLPYLVSLTFRNIKNITGSIPQSIKKLKLLKWLDLSYLSLPRLVSNFLNHLTALTYLDLSTGQITMVRSTSFYTILKPKNSIIWICKIKDFSCSIPHNLSDLKNIRTIQLDGNKLTGSVPESFGKFNGTIPELYLSRNKLTGPIPKSLGANQFEFDLTKVKFPKDLNWLDISHNKIFGGIPEVINDLDNLYKLKVGHNMLCGKIPTGGNMQRLKTTSFFHNKCLCGHH
ncbi:hypothetical protein MKX01_027096 [Papaver californicum]|nr:hypothetical protein MKX01_027096 [Papaver californicum]